MCVVCVAQGIAHSTECDDDRVVASRDDGRAQKNGVYGAPISLPARVLWAGGFKLQIFEFTKSPLDLSKLPRRINPLQYPQVVRPLQSAC